MAYNLLIIIAFPNELYVSANTPTEAHPERSGSPVGVMSKISELIPYSPPEGDVEDDDAWDD